MDKPTQSNAGIYIGRDISPSSYEVCVVSFDNEGTPGSLNTYVWDTLGLKAAERPNASDLSSGFAIVHSKPLILCVVTIEHSRKTPTGDLLEYNLGQALRSFLLNFQDYPAKLWLPLMGTGSGGLSHTESARITLRVLAQHWNDFVANDIEVGLALDRNLPDSVVQQIVYQAETYKFDTAISSDLRDSTFTSPGSGRERARSKRRKTTASDVADRIEPRPYTDDLVPLADAPPIQAKLGFPEFARGLVNLVCAITAEPEADRETSQGRGRVLLTAREAKLTVGLFAPWGAGKSTLINCLGEEFHKRGYQQFLINPWKWDGVGTLHDYVRRSVMDQAFPRTGRRWIPDLKRWPIWYLSTRAWLRANSHVVGWIVFGLIFLILFGKNIASIIAAPNQRDLWAPAANDWTGITLVGQLIVAVAGPQLLKVIGNAFSGAMDRWIFASNPDQLGANGLAGAYHDITRLLRSTTGRLPFIFYFDDLDRCQPERAVAVLDSVHSLTSTGCVVFIACDDKFVSAAVMAQYEKLVRQVTSDEAKRFGLRYLEKIVQVPFRLPYVRNEGIYELGLAQRASSNAPLGAMPSPSGVPAASPPLNRAFDSNAQPISGSIAAKAPDPNAVRLKEIISRLLGETVEALGLNVRQVKSITNTMKLYLSLDNVGDEMRATRLAAFVLADRCDPDWLDAHYLGTDETRTLIGSSDGVGKTLGKILGNEREELARLYHLLGRRPPLASQPTSMPAAPAPA